jgi:nitrite reductase/ring-hydroxylating ferredoxin subunit
MEDLIERDLRALCKFDDIKDGTSAGFPPAPGGFNGLMAVRQGDDVYVYVNSCPHVGTPLDWTPGRFLSANGKRIICATHGAEFQIENGMCTLGPCQGEALEKVAIQIQDGTIYVPQDAGL